MDRQITLFTSVDVLYQKSKMDSQTKGYELH